MHDPLPLPPLYTRTSKKSAHVKINLLNTLSTAFFGHLVFSVSVLLPALFFVCILAFSVYFFFLYCFFCLLLFYIPNRTLSRLCRFPLYIYIPPSLSLLPCLPFLPCSTQPQQNLSTTKRKPSHSHHEQSSPLLAMTIT